MSDQNSTPGKICELGERTSICNFGCNLKEDVVVHITHRRSGFGHCCRGRVLLEDGGERRGGRRGGICRGGCCWERKKTQSTKKLELKLALNGQKVMRAALDKRCYSLRRLQGSMGGLGLQLRPGAGMRRRGPELEERRRASETGGGGERASKRNRCAVCLTHERETMVRGWED